MTRNPIDQDRFPLLWIAYQRELALKNRIDQLIEIWAVCLIGLPFALIEWTHGQGAALENEHELWGAVWLVLLLAPFFMAWAKSSMHKQRLSRLRAIESAATEASEPKQNYPA